LIDGIEFPIIEKKINNDFIEIIIKLGYKLNHPLKFKRK
jgi:hypothetical protein